MIEEKKKKDAHSFGLSASELQAQSQTPRPEFGTLGH